MKRIALFALIAVFAVACGAKEEAPATDASAAAPVDTAPVATPDTTKVDSAAVAADTSKQM
jgi:PBP1b-binding outer membrane lipoprotein LpoB